MQNNLEVVPVSTLTYKVSKKKASKVFGIDDKMLDFDIPVFEWSGKHDHVPEKDPNYELRADYLVPILWALATNKKAWLSGHTGTGKSTLISQIAAYLNWPMLRVNFDSEITRMDLVGRDVLERKQGTTVSRFVDGILPQALSGPYILLCDEVDFIRPDVAYVFQRALEDQGLLISEDGGRVVHPHQYSRIIATANTQGQGDDTGIYQGARAQSLAFLDRFTVWLTCDYLSKEQEEKIIKAKVKGISKDRLKEVIDYMVEHRQAFTSSKIMQPLSPRGIGAFAEASVLFEKLGAGDNTLKKAATHTLLNKANETDASVMTGILDRIANESASAMKARSEKGEKGSTEPKQNVETRRKNIMATLPGGMPDDVKEKLVQSLLDKEMAGA